MRFSLFHSLSFSLLILLSFPETVTPSDDFHQWLSQEQKDFKEYRDRRDKEFTRYLKDQWREMQVFQGLSRDTTPKPDVIPVATSKRSTPEEHTVIHSPISKPVSPEPIPPEKPVDITTTDTHKAPIYKGKALDIDFYGHKLRFFYDQKLHYRLSNKLDKMAISAAWSALSKADYESFSRQLESERKSLSLNDWGFTLLLHAIATSLHTDSNSQSIFIWFFMTKAGYNTRIAYDNRLVYLLLPAKQQLFSTPYFVFNNLRYYAVSFPGAGKLQPTKIFTYKSDYPDANNLLDMHFSQINFDDSHLKKRRLTFTYLNNIYTININYNEYRIEYLDSYPQLDISMYFQSDIDSVTKESLASQLKTMIDGKSEIESVNIILRFVQTAFDYKTDLQQFGTENYLLPEETLFYPYSDCEDRSVLFAWLVRNLLGKEVVGLNYPGHVSVALHLNTNYSGDSVLYNGKKYVVADPTYTNAALGISMPQYKQLKPEIIIIR